MAIFNGKNIKGSIGPISFTQRGNVSMIRSKPGKGGVKQTAATKSKASLFGRIISPFSKLWRQSMAPLHLGFYDGTMVNRMNGAIATLINQHVKEEGGFVFKADDFSRLNGFDFNSNSPLNKSFLINPKIEIKDAVLTLLLPKFDVAKNLKYPRNAAVCELNFQLVLYSTHTGHWQIQNAINLQISKSQAIQDAKNLDFNIPKGCLAILGCSITYTAANSKILLNDKSFHPAGIVTAIYQEGDAVIDFSAGWTLLGVKLS